MAYERIPMLPVTPAVHSPEYIVERDEITPEFFVFKFTVIGKGVFPFDMLRTDECFPADTTSAMNIEEPQPGTFARKHLREVVLVSRVPRKLWLPTFDRWVSFGWFVKSTAWEG